jgi:hypothetical protein
MKKLLLLIPLIFLLSGCGMNNDEIIAETKKCINAGLKVEIIYNGFTYDIDKINCIEKPILTNAEEICKNQGGVPIFSGWTGLLKRCEFKK